MEENGLLRPRPGRKKVAGTAAAAFVVFLELALFLVAARTLRAGLSPSALLSSPTNPRF